MEPLARVAWVAYAEARKASDLRTVSIGAAWPVYSTTATTRAIVTCNYLAKATIDRK
jgi:hypothetical protein